MNALLASLRITVATMAICVAGYSAAVWAFAQAAAPHTAEASLILSQDGTVRGSSQIAQAFIEPRYFWPRPSAVNYDAAGAGGSNKSPTSPEIAERGREIAAAYGATSDKPFPAELAAASGSGLDPHISEAGALYQAARIAEARDLSAEEVEALIRRDAFAPGGFLGPDRIVNVLELNLALDAL